jgi:tetratricopeptide (TPR) repeat protein
MWQKYYRIAERQLESGKFRTFEAHALKALEYARVADNEKQVAQSLSLLSKFYMDTDNPKAGDTLSECVASTEKAYGPSSLELAEALELLSCVLEFVPNKQEAETARLKALAIRESLGHWEDLLDALDLLVQFYIDDGRFEQAHIHFLRALDLRKHTYGATSEEVEAEVETYTEILEGLGRGEEAEELEELFHRCSSCGPESGHTKYSAEADAIIASINEVQSERDLGKSIEALRNSLGGLLAIAQRHSEQLTESADPFAELKMRAHYSPYRWAKSSLAQLLRLQAEVEGQCEPLSEAAEHLRQLLSEEDLFNNRLHLILALLDLAASNDECYDELDSVIAQTPVCATTMYTKALAMFRRWGSAPKSRAAMKAALNFNSYVPIEMGNPSLADAPNHFEFGSRAEAQGYCLEAIKQWSSTPGAAEFMIEAMAGSLPTGWRKAIDQIAPPVPALLS